MKEELFSALWPNICRALEVAAVADLPVSIHYDARAYPNGARDAKGLAKEWPEVRFVPYGALRLCLTQPDSSELASTERLRVMSAAALAGAAVRIEFAKTSKLEPSAANSSGALALLETAIERLGLSAADVANVRKIETVIARLGGHADAQIEHLAEAIMYAHGDPDLSTAFGQHTPFFYPWPEGETWDGDLEVAPVFSNGSWCERLTEDDDPRTSFWSVYAHLCDGGSRCLADLSDKATAEAFAALIGDLRKNTLTAKNDKP